MKTVHEVEKNGNLYFLANAFIGALNRLADQIGGGLQAVALALATEEDNSAEIKALTDKLAASRESLETAINSNKA
jgi:hypothetical protein